MQCVRCNHQLRLEDFVLLEDNESDPHDHLVMGLCECSEMMVLSEELEHEYWQQRLLDAHMEWSREAHHPF